jgi:endogenous inhibitor of DNA gyrase (YacG/DUF329 family)
MTAPSQPDSTPDDAAGIVGITRLFFRCGYCEKTVEKRYADQKFCSRSCSNRAHSPARKTIECSHCGKLFEKQYADHKFCSRPCANHHKSPPPGFYAQHVKRPRLLLTCQCCGKEFEQRKPSRVDCYCSKECIRIGRTAAWRSRITEESHIKQKQSLSKTIAADPRLRKGPENHKSKVWRLRSPRGVTYEFKNLNHFIRQNPDLFSPEDVEWRPGHKGRGKTCRARGGLMGICPRLKNPCGGWKGWMWWSITERLHGGDLLNRKNSELNP